MSTSINHQNLGEKFITTPTKVTYGSGTRKFGTGVWFPLPISLFKRDLPQVKSKGTPNHKLRTKEAKEEFQLP